MSRRKRDRRKNYEHGSDIAYIYVYKDIVVDVSINIQCPLKQAITHFVVDSSEKYEKKKELQRTGIKPK